MRFTVPSTATELYSRVSPATARRPRRPGRGANPAVNERSTGQVRVDGAHPPGERVLVAGQILNHPSEAGDVPHGGVQLGTAHPDCMQKHRIGWVKPTRKAGDPAGDLAHCRRLWVRRQRRPRRRSVAAAGSGPGSYSRRCNPARRSRRATRVALRSPSASRSCR